MSRSRHFSPAKGGIARRKGVLQRRASDRHDKSLVDRAYQVISRRILDNVYPPGFQATQEDLGASLGISRTPVREALIRLEGEGLVEMIPRHGMRILPLSPEIMKEIYEVLAALESMAVEIVARRRPTEREIEPLADATREMDAALKKNDLDAWARADERFHRHLIELSGNRLLIQTVLKFWDRAHRARMFTLRLRRKPVHSTREHMKLVRLLSNGDVQAAVQAYRSHRERASRELLDIFERHQLMQI